MVFHESLNRERKFSLVTPLVFIAILGGVTGVIEIADSFSSRASFAAAPRSQLAQATAPTGGSAPTDANEGICGEEYTKCIDPAKKNDPERCELQWRSCIKGRCVKTDTKTADSCLKDPDCVDACTEVTAKNGDLINCCADIKRGNDCKTKIMTEPPQCNPEKTKLPGGGGTGGDLTPADYEDMRRGIDANKGLIKDLEEKRALSNDPSGEYLWSPQQEAELNQLKQDLAKQESAYEQIMKGGGEPISPGDYQGENPGAIDKALGDNAANLTPGSPEELAKVWDYSGVPGAPSETFAKDPYTYDAGFGEAYSKENLQKQLDSVNEQLNGSERYTMSDEKYNRLLDERSQLQGMINQADIYENSGNPYDSGLKPGALDKSVVDQVSNDWAKDFNYETAGSGTAVASIEEQIDNCAYGGCPKELVDELRAARDARIAELKREEEGMNAIGGMSPESRAELQRLEDQKALDVDNGLKRSALDPSVASTVDEYKGDWWKDENNLGNPYAKEQTEAANKVISDARDAQIEALKREKESAIAIGDWTAEKEQQLRDLEAEKLEAEQGSSPAQKADPSASSVGDTKGGWVNDEDKFGTETQQRLENCAYGGCTDKQIEDLKNARIRELENEKAVANAGAGENFSAAKQKELDELTGKSTPEGMGTRKTDTSVFDRWAAGLPGAAMKDPAFDFSQGGEDWAKDFNYDTAGRDALDPSVAKMAEDARDWPSAADSEMAKDAGINEIGKTEAELKALDRANIENKLLGGEELTEAEQKRLAEYNAESAPGRKDAAPDSIYAIENKAAGGEALTPAEKKIWEDYDKKVLENKAAGGEALTPAEKKRLDEYNAPPKPGEKDGKADVPLPPKKPSQVKEGDGTPDAKPEAKAPTAPPGGGGPAGGGGEKPAGGGGGGNPLGAFGSLLEGLMKALTAPKPPSPAPAQTCSTDRNIYEQQQQQYQQQLQQYNYQLQQQQYQKQLGQYYADRYGAAPPPDLPFPQQPTPCTPSTGSQCQNQPPQPSPNNCTVGYWQATYSGACVTGWQCIPRTGTTTAPVATLSCEPEVVDVGQTIAITYGCSSGLATSSSFRVTTQPGGSATTTAANPPAGANTATYSLACVDEGRTSGAQCSVQVSRPTIILVANPSTVTASSTSATSSVSLISWLTTGMDSCVISSPDMPGFTLQNMSNTSVNGAATTSPLTAAARVHLECLTTAGNLRGATTTVHVAGIPDDFSGDLIEASSTIDRMTVPLGATTTIKWRTINAPFNSAMSLWILDVQSGQPAGLIAGGKPTSGTFVWQIPQAGDACPANTPYVCAADLVSGREYLIEADLYTPPDADLGEPGTPSSAPDPLYLEFGFTNSFTMQ